MLGQNWRQWEERFVKQAYGCNQQLKVYQIVDNVKNVLRPNKVFNRYDVTYIVVVLGLGLASQRGRRFDKSTNENAWNLYGYKEMSQPQLLVQAQV